MLSGLKRGMISGFACAAMLSGTTAGICQPRANPAARVEFSSCRVSSSSNGSVYLYLRNEGAGELKVENIFIDGKDMSALLEGGGVSWYRVRPDVISPGGSAEVLVRFETLPRRVSEELFFDQDAVCRMKVELDLSGGRKLSEEVKISLAPDPFQLNFIGFGENLDKLYLYFQNNRWVLEGDETPLALERIWVNGKDLTRRSRFGSRVLGGNVVPVEVSLEEPLEWGAPAVVTAEAAGGFMAGHALRAFPSEFLIRVGFFGPQVRADSVRDVYNHCATAVRSPNRAHVEEAKEFGLGCCFRGGRMDPLINFWKPGYPEIKCLFLDEMDRWPARKSWEIINDAKEFFRPQGKRVPPYTLNIMGVSTPAGGNYLEIGDAITHGYGMDGGGLGGRNFAGFDSIHGREHRLARRPFWPYFRNAEMGLEVEEGTDRIIGPSPIRPYPMHPMEKRWLTYGTLMQGAKGMLHWGYGVWKTPPPPAFNWMSREHHALRIGMGGLAGEYAYGYRIPDEIAEDLGETWREIGRINAELRTIGDVVAKSDVCSRARITRVSPEKGTGFHDERSAEAAALVSGLDTMVVIVLNMNIDTTWKSGFREREDRMRAYPPADVTVEVEVPGWLSARDFFTVTYEGIERVRPKRTGRNLLEFEFAGVEVSRVLVITSDRTLREQMAATLREMQGRLARIEADEPVPIPELTVGEDLRTVRMPASDEDGVVYLSDISPASVSQGWGELGIDRSVSGGVLTLADASAGEEYEYEKGLGTHARSEIIYRLDEIPGDYSFLEGVAGKDRASPGGTVVFRVYVDGERMYESGVKTYFTAPERFSVPVKGAEELKLVVTDAGDGIESDHANWAGIRLR